MAQGPRIAAQGQAHRRGARDRVRIWAEDVVLQTYRAGEPCALPMFLDRRVYQGSSGRVYPYPVIDRVADRPVDERHHVVFLENRYLRVMVMPAFGGRIQYAYDKTNGYPFIYHNRVIKPALVGLAGPWLSGGIEFNWPQHHKPGTYCPVDYTITAAPDGSGTLWLGDIDPMWHLRGTFALTLRPDRAVLDVAIRLFNPTPVPQSMHLWTNPAVHVNDDYQSVFPPDVHAVYDHGKRDVSAFPIARGHYYKVDYTRGVDISRYRNIPVPTSYMAAGSRYDFLGGYDHGRQAGVLHVADHHVVPGKKQWVWGCGEFGRAWDRNLTDEDGPYAELMCGVFADNQPDFTWLQPYEDKQVTQSFLPYKGIGPVQNATVDAAVSLSIEDGAARIGAYASSPQASARVRLRRGSAALWEHVVDLGPDAPMQATIRIPRGLPSADVTLDVLASDGRHLVSYTPAPPGRAGLPEPAAPLPEPRELQGADALVLAGRHLEQYRHATRRAEDYYAEALRRDPGDLRANTALGLLWVRRGQFARAEPLLRQAIATATRHDANPADGEPFYALGVCLRALDRPREAFDAFAKATWSAAWFVAGTVQLAQLAASDGRLEEALSYARAVLGRHELHTTTVHLCACLLRRLGRAADADLVVARGLLRDPLHVGLRNERVLLLRAAGRIPEAERDARALLAFMRADAHAHLELAATYAHGGERDAAIDVLQRALDAPDPHAARAPGHEGAVGLPNLRPMLAYTAGYYALRQGDTAAAARHFARGAKEPPDRCFPNSLESIAVLEAALALRPRDARAAAFLGDLWYDARDTDAAVRCWRRARLHEPDRAVLHRNLAIAWFNRAHDHARARRSMRRAWTLGAPDARLLYEYDLLEQRLGATPEVRLRRLSRYPQAVASRDDLAIEHITLLNTVGRHDEALAALSARRFHPWEGGEGRVSGQYRVSLVALARASLDRGDADAALGLLQRARSWPEHLGEGKLHGALENEELYWMGAAHRAAGRRVDARRCWDAAAIGMERPVPALYYNDQDPATIYWQALALRALGRARAADARFEVLAAFGRAHLHERARIDYFAVSLPGLDVFEEDLQVRHEANCRFLVALGQRGLGRTRAALQELRRVLRLAPSHQGAHLQARDLQHGAVRHAAKRRA